LTLSKMAALEASIEDEHRKSGKGTFVHAFCSGRAAVWQRQLQVKYLGENAFYPLEAKLKALCINSPNVYVW